MKRTVLIVWAVALALLAGWSAARRGGVLLNTTASMPRGLWRVRPGPLHRGDVVLVCPPDLPVFQAARRANVVPPGRCSGNYEPILKRVAALAGDQVLVAGDGLHVNGELVPHSTPSAATDPKLVDLLRPVPPGRYVVGDQHAWVLSSAPRSWDSRYFGPLPLAGLLGVAQPLLVEAP